MCRGGRSSDAEAKELERELLTHLRTLAPRLLEEAGIAPLVAARLIVGGRNSEGSPLFGRPLRTGFGDAG